MIQSLAILKTEETKVVNYSKTLGSTIGVNDCVTGTALICNPCKQEYTVLIGKGLAKMFTLHGKTYSIDTITIYLESLTQTYSHETPETILLFLKKAGNGDFGKFYGEPDIGTVREWFTDFLQSEIIPERERQHAANLGGSGQRNLGTKGIQPIKQIYSKVTKEKEFKKGKVRNL